MTGKHDSESNKKKTKKRVTSKNTTKNNEKNKKQKGKFSKKHPKLAMALRILIVLILLMCVVGAGIVAGMFFGLFGDDFDIAKEELTIAASNSMVLDKDGNVIADLSGDERRKIISLSDMSEYLPKAYVAIEDERFYEHSGVDIKRTAGAIFTYITHAGKSSFGGSTITQQLVKNITDDSQDSGIEGIFRKVKEWSKAYQVERLISKDQILELYLNILFVGGNNYGVELGSEYYFNKSAGELDLAQCAFLAGINNSPNAYNPYGTTDNTEKIKKRTTTVLKKMLDLKYITQEQYDEAAAEVEAGLTFEKSTAAGNIYSYHTDAAIAQVISDIAEEKGISTQLAENYVYSSGLTIYSTQDTTIQASMEEEFKKTKQYTLKSKVTQNEDGTYATSQAAMVLIDHTTGYVLGTVGGLGEKTESRGLNRATQSIRQTGSSMKPLADLVPGIQEGVITAATVYNDSATTFAGNYNPGDYNTPRGLVSVRSAIETSQNIPFVKVMAELTPVKSLEYLRKMGISTLDDTNDATLSMAIGGLYKGISPLEMAAAYASIANNGEYIEPTFYTKVTDSNGDEVLSKTQTRTRVCSEATAYVVKNILTSTVTGSQGTATYCGISGIDVAAKTGTTNDSKDRWLCGFTNYYTASVWYGFDQPERINYSGRNPAGQIWDSVMTSAHKGLATSKFEMPSNVVTATICRDTGMLATDKCTNTYSEIFVNGTVPSACEGHTSYEICTESGLLANEYCTAKETKYTSNLVPKEQLKLWNTAANGTVTTAPTEVCTIHKAPEVAEKPKEPTTTNTTTNTTTTNTTTTNTTTTNTTINTTTGDDTKKNQIKENAVE